MIRGDDNNSWCKKYFIKFENAITASLSSAYRWKGYPKLFIKSCYSFNIVAPVNSKEIHISLIGAKCFVRLLKMRGIRLASSSGSGKKVDNHDLVFIIQ